MLRKSNRPSNLLNIETPRGGVYDILIDASLFVHIIGMAGLLHGIAREEGRTLLVMGHGTEHRANAAYSALHGLLPDDVKLACVEGDLGLDGILDELESVPGKKLTLMPLMLVAGDHAKNDLAGDEEDSWKSRLQARGFDIALRLEGLGALKPVQERIVEKARRAIY